MEVEEMTIEESYETIGDDLDEEDACVVEDEHGHICPDCGVTFYCYRECPEDEPYMLCTDCD